MGEINSPIFAALVLLVSMTAGSCSASNAARTEAAAARASADETLRVIKTIAHELERAP